jgi:hypothetical protein
LLVPSRVADGAPGNTANSEALVTTSISIGGGLPHPWRYQKGSCRCSRIKSCRHKKGADQRRLSKSNTASRTEPLKHFYCCLGIVSSDPRQHEQGPFASGQTLGCAPPQCIGNYPLCLTEKARFANQSVSDS